MSVQEAVNKYSALPSGRLRVCQPNGLQGIEAGIVFVLATWSGPALFALQALTALLAAEYSDFHVPVFVWDTDAVPTSIAQALGVPLKGNGETFWVLNGRIVGVLLEYRRASSADEVRRNTELLRHPRTP